jgi:hypothetical protein
MNLASPPQKFLRHFCVTFIFACTNSTAQRYNKRKPPLIMHLRKKWNKICYMLEGV